MSQKQIPEHQLKRLEDIRQYIKTWRSFESQTQREFSNMAEIHVNTFQKFETQKTTDISVLTLFAMIDAMDGITLSQFFEGME